MASLPDGGRAGHHADLMVALRQVGIDIRRFIEISLQEPEFSCEQFLELSRRDSPVRCWERKRCAKRDCPAYGNACGRCWLLAGTMCGGTPQGEFALKYKSCTECEVYQECVFKDPVAEIYEHLVTLVHTLKTTQDKLKALAVRDALTGLHNRNYFSETICREIEKARRQGQCFSLVMIDVDNFKRINDDYGHLYGDGILRECAKILAEAVRSSDILCRYGGDEFLILTPGTDCQGDRSLIARIGQLVEEWNEAYASPGCRLSLSLGCATWVDGRAVSEVLDEADGMMYHDKARKAAL